MCRLITTIGLAVLSALLCSASANAQSLGKTPNDEVRVLFLGDNGHIVPRERFAQLEPVLRSRGIALTYTDRNHRPQRRQSGQVRRALALREYRSHRTGRRSRRCSTTSPAAADSCRSIVLRFAFAIRTRCVALIGAQFRVTAGAGCAKRSPKRRSSGHAETTAASRASTKPTSITAQRERTARCFPIASTATKREPWTWVRTARQRPRVLHRVGPRPAHLESSGLSQSGRARHSLGRRQRSGRGRRRIVARAPFVVPKMTKLPDGSAAV